MTFYETNWRWNWVWTYKTWQREKSWRNTASRGKNLFHT